MHIKAPGILSSSFPSASLPLWLRSALHQLLLCCVRPGLCCLHVKMSITTTPTHSQILAVSYRGQCTLDMSADTYCQHALKTVIHSSTAKSLPLKSKIYTTPPLCPKKGSFTCAVAGCYAIGGAASGPGSTSSAALIGAALQLLCQARDWTAPVKGAVL